MFKGILFALGACFIWGFIFVIPQFMINFTSIEVTMGRYVFYGVISALIFAKSKIRGTCNYPRHIWIKALWFSLISTIVYFTFLVLGLRYCTPAICTLILGIAPIVIAFYGNWKQKEVSFRSLVIPSFLILIGLICINLPNLSETRSLTTHMWGLLFSLIALITWSWYAVTNSRLLKKHPEIHSSDWTTLVGMATLFWVVIFTLFFATFFPSQLNIHKFLIFDQNMVQFLIGSAVLGVVCSWIGAFLWNRASFYLPISLAGQITIFETIFGIFTIYLVEKKLPPRLECIGILLFIVAIAYCIHQFARKPTAYPEIN